MPRATRFRARNCVPRAVAAAALVVTGCAAADPVPGHPVAAKPIWQMTFSDEFDGPADSPPDPARWLPDVGGSGWGNHELQYYTRSGNVFVDGDGHLVIEARAASGNQKCWYGRCRYTSGKVTTRSAFSQAYGHFEARIKVPGGRGFLPAFWLLGDNVDTVRPPIAGEIDVVETLGGQPGEVQQHAHGPGLDFGGPFQLPIGQSVVDWHTYAVEWRPDRITWGVDGRLTRVLLRATAGSGWVFDHPFFVLLNLAVGGEWPGSPDEETRFPARLLVDYVRCFASES